MKSTAKSSPFVGPGLYRSSPDPAVPGWLTKTFAAAGLMLVLVLATPLDIWWSSALARPWEQASTGTLVILSGPSADHGSLLADSSYWRALYAVRSWREGHFQKVLIVGQPSAQEMALFLAGSGIPKANILVEPQPADTRQSALAVQRLAPQLPAPLVLLTSDFHIFRAAHAFQKAGLHPKISPFPDGIKRGQLRSWYKRPSVFGDLIFETIEIVRYRWNGWI